MTFITNGPGGRMYPGQARLTRRGNKTEPTQADVDALVAKIAKVREQQKPENLKAIIAEEVAAAVARLDAQIQQLKGEQAMAERDSGSMAVHCDWSDELPGGDDDE